MGRKPGYEELDLDLDRVPSVAQGLADAADRYRRFADFAREAITASDDMVFFESHIPLYSFINRAVSLHAGIISAVKETNPHAAFTLLRAYLELVVLIRYVDRHPDYREALKRPMSELPKHTRKRWDELFEDAATEMAGVRHVYAVLSEMAHFGSTALWHPFTVNEAEDRRMSYGTAPHWKKPDDARIVLGMLQEADEAAMVVLLRYRDHHVSPLVDRHVVQQRTARKLAAYSGNHEPGPTGDVALGWATLPPDLAREAMAEGVIAHCAEHEVLEVAAAVSPEQFEDWVEARVSRRIEALAAEVYGDGAASFFTTPQESLGGRTPREAIDAGDSDQVLGAIAKAVAGESA